MAKEIIQELEAEMMAAHKALFDALKAEYPIGSVWLVHTRDGQKVASAMTVFGHSTNRGAEVRFMRERPQSKFKRWQAPFRADVPVRNILCLA